MNYFENVATTKTTKYEIQQEELLVECVKYVILQFQGLLRAHYRYILGNGFQGQGAEEREEEIGIGHLGKEGGSK